MTFTVSDLQSDSDLDRIRNYWDVYLFVNCVFVFKTYLVTYYIGFNFTPAADFGKLKYKSSPTCLFWLQLSWSPSCPLWGGGAVFGLPLFFLHFLLLPLQTCLHPDCLEMDSGYCFFTLQPDTRSKSKMKADMSRVLRVNWVFKQVKNSL